MSNLAFAYALGAGASLATYVIGLRLGSAGTHPALGTAIVTGIAFLINVAVTLSIRATGAPITFSMTSGYCLLVVGVATAAVNLFTLLAYANACASCGSPLDGGALVEGALGCPGCGRTFILPRAGRSAECPRSPGAAQITPCASMASATLTKPAMFAPST